MTNLERKKIFSRNLLNVLNKTQKTQIEVAIAIGVSQQTFNSWCRGVALPRMDKIQMLADHFNINMADLIEANPSSISAVPVSLRPDEYQLLDKYNMLNDAGKEYMNRQADYATQQVDFLKDSVHAQQMA